VPEPGTQCLALDQLGDDECGGPILRELEDGKDVRMGELRDAHRFTLEARERVAIRCEARCQNLDGHVAIQPWIARAIHVPHAACAERSDDLVMSETCAAEHRHACRCEAG